jgi:ribosome-binding ATPase YchF (GTP1/OBG family)
MKRSALVSPNNGPVVCCQVPPTITITDIAGLVKGASEGAGLGNAFLSHIQVPHAGFAWTELG